MPGTNPMHDCSAVYRKMPLRNPIIRAAVDRKSTILAPYLSYLSGRFIVRARSITNTVVSNQR